MPEKFSRRDILKGLGALVGLAALGGDSTQKSEDSVDHQVSKKNILQEEREEKEKLDNFLVSFCKFSRAIEDKYGSFETRSLAFNEKLRQSILTGERKILGLDIPDLSQLKWFVGGVIKFYEQRIREIPPHNEYSSCIRLNEIFSACGSVGCVDLFYKAVSESGNGTHKDLLEHKLLSQSRFAEFHYYSKTLPKGEAILDLEIEPFLNWKYTSQATTEYFDSLLESPHWTDPPKGQERVEKFRQIVNDPRVREKINLNKKIILSEVYSIIKATIREWERGGFKGDFFMIFQYKLDTHNTLIDNKQQIVGDKTDTCIILYSGTAAKMRPAYERSREDLLSSGTGSGPQSMPQEGDIMYYSGKKVQEAFVAAGTNPDVIKMHSKDNNKKIQELAYDWLNSIENSSGVTFVYAHSDHGGNENMQLTDNENGITHEITAERLAQAFMARFIRAGALEKITIYFTQCNTYEFSENFIKSLKDQYAKLGLVTTDIPPIRLPTIITSSQPNNIVTEQSNGNFFSILETCNRDSGFSYEDLIRRLEPANYKIDDMSIFLGGNAEPEEIGVNEHKNLSTKSSLI